MSQRNLSAQKNQFTSSRVHHKPKWCNQERNLSRDFGKLLPSFSVTFHFSIIDLEQTNSQPVSHFQTNIRCFLETHDFLVLMEMAFCCCGRSAGGVKWGRETKKHKQAKNLPQKKSKKHQTDYYPRTNKNFLINFLCSNFG